jgi:hypothetical protein
VKDRTRTHLDTIITAAITIVFLWWGLPALVDLILWIWS